MYVPRANAWTDEPAVRAHVEAVGAGQLVTVDADGRPQVTLLPLLWDGDRVVLHVARANPHWRTVVDGGPALIVVDGPQAYVSPTWYPSKTEHGRVVPTWNYLSVHLRGTVSVHDDPGWLREAVDRLTDRHEGRRARPWSTDDAPERYVEKQLRAIVGIEVRVTGVEAKAKLSQNRSEADQQGVVAGIRAEGQSHEQPVADAMAAADGPGS